MKGLKQHVTHVPGLAENQGLELSVHAAQAVGWTSRSGHAQVTLFSERDPSMLQPTPCDLNSLTEQRGE